MKLKKLLSFMTATVLTIVPVSSLIACKKNNYDALQNALKNKETFVAYVGISNCPACQLLEPIWDRWTKETNWDSGIKNLENQSLKINRYKWGAEYTFTDKDPVVNFSKTKWVKNIFDWTKAEQKKLWESNKDIKAIVSKDVLPTGLPLLLFVKNGEYRWFTTGWGEEGIGNDLQIQNESEFRNKQALNTSTLTKLVKDFIIGDFSNFYEFKADTRKQ